MKEIKLGDEQPSPCPKCNKTDGYLSELVQPVTETHYYDSKGKWLGNATDIFDTDKKARRKTLLCANCGSKLNFKLV